MTAASLLPANRASFGQAVAGRAQLEPYPAALCTSVQTYILSDSPLAQRPSPAGPQLNGRTLASIVALRNGHFRHRRRGLHVRPRITPFAHRHFLPKRHIQPYRTSLRSMTLQCNPHCFSALRRHSILAGLRALPARTPRPGRPNGEQLARKFCHRARGRNLVDDRKTLRQRPLEERYTGRSLPPAKINSDLSASQQYQRLHHWAGGYGKTVLGTQR